MFKVLAVDDEPLMLEGWKSMIDWNAFGYELSGTAMDGEEALDVIRTIKPDVVLTDIRMPVLDGLDLIRIVTEDKDLHIHFIIVSGYSEFAYAQQALRYGVYHYILKPLVVNEMHKLLNELNCILEKERLDQLAADNDRLLVEAAAIANCLKHGNGSDIFELAELLKIEEDSLLRLIILERTSGLMAGVQADDSHILEIWLRDLLESVSGEQIQTWSFTESPNRMGVLICLNYNHKQDNFIGVLEEQINSGDKSLVKLNIYVSEVKQGLNYLPEMYCQILELKRNSIFDKKFGVHLYHNDLKVGNYSWEDLFSYFETLLYSIETNNEESINHTIDNLICLLDQAKSHTGWVRNAINYLRGELLRNYSISSFDRELLKQLLQESYLEQKECFLGDTLKNLCLRITSELKTQNSNTQDSTYFLTEVIEYLKLHYREKIKIQELAERFHYNPVYFGKQFKVKMGMRLIDYIHSLRIEEAKILLCRTDMKLFEIASYLGYHNTEYFAIKFKAFTNELPSSFKNKCRGDQSEEKKG